MIPVMDIKSIGITYEQWTSACFQAESRAVESEEVQSVQRRAAQHGRWDLVYNLSLIAGLETSVLIDANGEISMIGSGSFIQFTHTFQMPVSWNDEPYASLNVMLVSPTGPTLPLNHVFGLGNANGIENDVSLKGFTASLKAIGGK